MGYNLGMDYEKINAMREGGKIMAQIFRDLREYTKVGMTGRQISDWVEKQILDAGASVAYYEPEVDFPGSICVSVNDELIHGIPDIPVLEIKNERLVEQDYKSCMKSNCCIEY